MAHDETHDSSTKVGAVLYPTLYFAQHQHEQVDSVCRNITAVQSMQNASTLKCLLNTKFLSGGTTRASYVAAKGVAQSTHRSNQTPFDFYHCLIAALQGKHYCTYECYTSFLCLGCKWWESRPVVGCRDAHDLATDLDVSDVSRAVLLVLAARLAHHHPVHGPEHWIIKTSGFCQR